MSNGMTAADRLNQQTQIMNKNRPIVMTVTGIGTSYRTKSQTYYVETIEQAVIKLVSMTVHWTSGIIKDRGNHMLTLSKDELEDCLNEHRRNIQSTKRSVNRKERTYLSHTGSGA